MTLKHIFERLASFGPEALLEADMHVIALFLIAIYAICWPLVQRLRRINGRSASTATLKRQLGAEIPIVDEYPRDLESPLRTYTIVDELDPGDLCDVFGAVSGTNHYILKVPRFGGGNHLMAKEREVLGQLLDFSGGDHYREFLAPVCESFHVAGRRINAFHRRDGFYSAAQIRDRYPGGLGGRHIAWMFKRTLEAIGFVHQTGWLHGALLPPHLMFHAGDHGMQLTGWIHATQTNRPLQMVPMGYKSWYPPECQRKAPATPAVDIYLAAKTMVFLAGGNPLREFVPSHIPAEMRRFLESCLLPSAAMRPHDAWQLHFDFTELLEGLYGPPKYHQLVMP